jgi:hypothetical protein
MNRIVVCSFDDLIDAQEIVQRGTPHGAGEAGTDAIICCLHLPCSGGPAAPPIPQQSLLLCGDAPLALKYVLDDTLPPRYRRIATHWIIFATGDATSQASRIPQLG